MKATIKLFLAASLALTGLFACTKPQPEPEPEPTVTLSVAPATLSLEVGTTGKVTATVEPSGTAVTWTSSDKNVATVADGVVTAVGAGKATITATAEDKTATCEVTVTEAPIQYSITLSDEILSLEAGQTATITATVSPEGTPVQWGSTNEEVATVEDGVVTALTPGDVTITASAGDVTAQCLLTVREKEIIDDGEGVAIDLCESLTYNGPWQSEGEVVLDMEDKTQGGASLATTMPDGGVIIFQKPFETPIDASSIDPDKAVLSMDVWIEDISKLNLGGNPEASQFEISSNPNPDQEEVSWPVSEWDLKNGWNHIELRFKGAKRNGDIDMSQIRRVRWYHVTNIGAMTIKIDDLRIVEREEEIDEGEGVLIDGCESLSDNGPWQTSGDLLLDMEDKTQGGASLSTTLTEGDQVQIIFQKPYETAIDASSIDPEKAVLSMDVWFEDITKLNLGGNVEASQFEISSSHNADQNEVSWPVSEWNIKNGWNHIELRFKGAKHNDEIDMSQIRRIRWYHAAKIGSTTIKIDNIRIVEREPANQDKPSDPNAIYIHHCEDVTGWHNVSFTVDSENHQEGKGCLSTTVGGDFVWIMNLGEAIDCSRFNRENGTLALDLYVSSAAGMKLSDGGNQIELSSTTNDDDHEYSWGLNAGSLVDGWNHLELKLSDAGISGGEPDMAAINHFRFYHVGWSADGAVTVKIDNIRLH